MGAEAVTETIEEYLETIYTMTWEGQRVIGARLASQLKVSPATITATIKRMVRDGLVLVNERKEVVLTPKGHELGRVLVRRHRLWERWLTDVMGMEWSKAHVEACKLEHHLSPEVEARLAASLNNPKTCPHGNPIPGGEEPAREETAKTLDQVIEGEQLRVLRITEEAESDLEVMRYLERKGFMPGTALIVTEISPLSGPITVTIGEGTVSVGREIAAHVWVQPKNP